MNLYYEASHQMLNKSILFQLENCLKSLEKFKVTLIKISWNEFLFKELHIRPSNIYMPLFIPLNKDKFQPHPQLAEQIGRIELPAQKHLQAPHVSNNGCCK